MSNPPFFTTDILKVPHGFFSREGGVSHGRYTSLNCRLKSDDKPHAVMENRRRVAQTLSGRLTEIHTAGYQFGGRAFEVTVPFCAKNRPSADALVTRQKGIILGGLGRDCPPVLLADSDHGVIAAVHGGYRCILENIIKNTVSAMVGLGARSQNIAAVIGPGIGVDSYEVDQAFRDRLGTFGNWRILNECIQQTDQAMKFNLPMAITILLQESGVGQIYNTGINTASNSNYFSARRNGPHDAGCHVAAICL